MTKEVPDAVSSIVLENQRLLREADALRAEARWQRKLARQRSVFRTSKKHSYRFSCSMDVEEGREVARYLSSAILKGMRPGSATLAFHARLLKAIKRIDETPDKPSRYVKATERMKDAARTVIARGGSWKEASEASGIPFETIKNWYGRRRTEDGDFLPEAKEEHDQG